VRLDVQPVRRTIDGFHQDADGEWVAELSCLHGQHVRHDPPFQLREWVLTASGRRAQVGTSIDCPPCARAELPDGLALARTAGPFDETSLPARLRRDHVVADGRWGRVRVMEGRVAFALQTVPPQRISLEPGDQQPIPPGIRHWLELDGPVQLEIDFLVPT
jgi:tellurite resistance-related uncharacterized protein